MDYSDKYIDHLSNDKYMDYKCHLKNAKDYLSTTDRLASAIGIQLIRPKTDASVLNLSDAFTHIDTALEHDMPKDDLIAELAAAYAWTEHINELFMYIGITLDSTAFNCSYSHAIESISKALADVIGIDSYDNDADFKHIDGITLNNLEESIKLLQLQARNIAEMSN